MIEINLVPEQLRKTRKSKTKFGSGFSLPKEAVVGLIGGGIILLLLVHALLQFFITVQFVQHKQLKGESESLAGEKAGVEVVLKDLKALQTKFKSVEKIAGTESVSWSQKLSEISLNSPRGVWLNRITLDGKVLLIQGSAVSKNKAEMINVHNFTSNLKNSEVFMASFRDLELGLIKSREINVTPIADFTIRADLKQETE